MIFYKYIKRLNYICIYMSNLYGEKLEIGLENASTNPKMGNCFSLFVLQLAFVFQGT